MTKRGSMAATAISVLIFVCPACQTPSNHDRPQLKGDSTLAPSDYGSTVSSSKEIGSRGMAEPTPREKGCADSRADKKCGKAADQCVYKFTVNELVDQKNVKVTYPPSVWEVTMDEAKNTENEKNYKKEYEKRAPYLVGLTASSATPTAGKTYLFTRCPVNEFTLGDEIQPNDESLNGTSIPRQSKP